MGISCVCPHSAHHGRYDASEVGTPGPFAAVVFMLAAGVAVPGEPTPLLDR
jgi:hypothetical protein